jgi:hypothetical protein
VDPVKVPEQRARLVVRLSVRAGQRPALHKLNIELTQAKQLVDPQAPQVGQGRRNLRQIAGQSVDPVVASAHQDIANVPNLPHLLDHRPGKVEF